jgi:alpha-galactosidase
MTATGLRARLPEVARAELGGLRFGVVHEAGPAEGREKRCAECYPDFDVLVFGHSHIPWDSTAPGGERSEMGVPRPKAGGGCSTPGRPPTAGGSHTART